MTAARAQFGSRKAARPIVSMNDIGLPVECFEQRERSAREESETNVVVAVTVDGRACEELRRFEKVSGRTRRVAKPETNVVNLAAPLDANVLDRTAIQEQTIDLIVERKDELRVNVLLHEGFRQCA